MTWKYYPSDLQLPESSPTASCCVRCATQLGKNPEIDCKRAHAHKACDPCEASEESCKPVPVFLQGQVDKLREIEDRDERIKACQQLTVEADSYEIHSISDEREANRLLRSLNHNVFRLVQLKRMKMGLDPLAPEDEEMAPMQGGGRVA
ncbi:uncharacterized protein KD926_000450 [Aspergillus affinis]|uniref:uncharacterized protein n=1 Tax=Aspergillus affinis TaxID=1070780 RepID=UPI0022FE6B69|nr:uncharacterized protein KD926_000450 [Aspergillus affinis]KAI9044539.1 hypothetical protein KD926_000450 [Aspergillus affinis]